MVLTSFLTFTGSVFGASDSPPSAENDLPQQYLRSMRTGSQRSAAMVVAGTSGSGMTLNLWLNNKFNYGDMVATQIVGRGGPPSMSAVGGTLRGYTSSSEPYSIDLDGKTVFDMPGWSDTKKKVIFQGSTDDFPQGSSHSLTLDLIPFNLEGDGQDTGYSGGFSMILQPTNATFFKNTALNFAVLNVRALFALAHKNTPHAVPVGGSYYVPLYFDAHVDYVQGNTKNLKALQESKTGLQHCTIPDYQKLGANTKVYYDSIRCFTRGDSSSFGVTSGDSAGSMFPCPTMTGHTAGLEWDACPTTTDKPSAFSYTTNRTGVDVNIGMQQDAFKNYVLGWEEVAVGGSQSLTKVVSWLSSDSGSDSRTSATNHAFTAGISGSIEFKEGFFFASSKQKITVAASTTHSWAKSTASSIERSESLGKSESKTCSTNPCDGRLYQWQISATNADQEVEYVKDCTFACVPHHVPEAPQCPLHYCSSASCQCCTSLDWADSGEHEKLKNLLLSNGCGSKSCSASGDPCKVNSDCCSNKCNIGPTLAKCM